ncbi:MAG: GYD domain-containing protein [Desulfobacterales bacterium]|nr:GYD domain-containing protein [Desulfobacterales bacterium]
MVDIVEADDPKEVEKAAMIIRGYGHSTTETLEGTPWEEFLDSLLETLILITHNSWEVKVTGCDHHRP